MKYTIPKAEERGREGEPERRGLIIEDPVGDEEGDDRGEDSVGVETHARRKPRDRLRGLGVAGLVAHFAPSLTASRIAAVAASMSTRVADALASATRLWRSHASLIIIFA